MGRTSHSKAEPSVVEFTLLVQRVDYKRRCFWATAISGTSGKSYGLQLHDYSHMELNPRRGQIYDFHGSKPYDTKEDLSEGDGLVYNSAFQAGDYKLQSKVAGEALGDFIVCNQFYYGIGQKKINGLLKVLSSTSVSLQQLLSDDQHAAMWEQADITKRSQEAFKLGYQLSEWQEDCLALGISYQATQRFFEVYQWKTVEVYQANPFKILAYEDSTDYAALWKALSQNYSDLKKESERAAVWVAFYEASADYQTSLDRNALLTRLGDLIGESAESVLDAVLKAGHVVKQKVQGLPHFQLASIYAFERAIADQLVSLNQTGMTGAGVRRIDWGAVFKSVGGRADFNKDYHQSQLKAFEDGQMLLIYGEAGTGKTYLSARILQACHAAGYAIEVIAVSNIAVSRVSAELEALLSQGDLSDRPTRYSSVTRFLNRKVDDDAVPFVLLIDEASMIGAGQALRVLSKIRPQDRLIMVGDPRQVPPIGWGAVFHALERIEKPAFNRLHLTECKRQSGDGLAILEMIKELEPDSQDTSSFEPSLVQAAANKDAIQICSLANDPIESLGAYLEGKKLKSLPPILCFCRDDVARVNWHIRMLRAQRDESKHGQIRYAGFSQLREGEPVINTVNLEQEGLWNGSRGRVVVGEGEDAGKLVARFELPDNSTRDQPINSGIERAYAVTVHRAQGEGHDKVIVYLGNGVPERLLHRGALYTAITRAAKELVFIGSVDEFNKGYAKPNLAQKTNFLELHFGSHEESEPHLLGLA